MKTVKKVEKKVKKTVNRASKKATKLVTKAAKGAGKLEAKWKEMVAQKEEMIKKLKGELADKKDVLRQGEETILEAMGKAKEEISAIKAKTDQTLMDWKSKAEAEYKKLKEELEKKADKKMAEAKAAAREFATKAAPAVPGRSGLVAFKGNPMTLLGMEVKVGDKAPDFKVVDNAMQPATLDSFRGKIKIITSVPSLDTPVCDMETRRFNQEADKMPDNVVVLTVSMDLPFAQKRWCAAAGVEKVKTLSDFQARSFGPAYGVLIKELQLLARAVFIVDDQDVVRYVEIVPEIAKEPDYGRVLEAVKALV
jgi:thioredoxin-dependent peroxiredoxin